MKRNDPVRFVIERDEPIRASAYERRIMRPYDEPVEIANGVLHLATRDPNGNDVIVAKQWIRPKKGEDARDLVRRLASHRSPDRGLSWVLASTPDEALQEAVAQEYHEKTGERLAPEHVYAGERESFFKPHQRPTASDTKQYGPFGIHTLNHRGRTTRIAIPTEVRLSTIEAEMAQRGPIEFYFGTGPYGESTLEPALHQVERYAPQIDETRTLTQVHGVRTPTLMHRDGRRFATHELGRPERVIDAYLTRPKK